MSNKNFIKNFFKKCEEKYLKIKENTQYNTFNKDIFPNSAHIMPLLSVFNKKDTKAEQKAKSTKENAKFYNKNIINTNINKIKASTNKTEKEHKVDRNKVPTLYFKQIPFATALSSISKSAPKAEINAISNLKNNTFTMPQKNTKIENTNIINNLEKIVRKEIHKHTSKELMQEKEIKTTFDCNSLVNSIASGVLQK